MISLRFAGTSLIVFLSFVGLRAQQSWQMMTSNTTQTLWGVCSNQFTGFVAVGEGGTIVTTATGNGWTRSFSNTTQWLLAVAWSPELITYVAVGDGGTILTSRDGISWTTRTSGTSQRLNSVAWGGGQFLVVGENGAALTSPDGITWTVRNTGDVGWLRGMAYGNGVFVITGHDGTILTTADRGTTFQHRIIATNSYLVAAVFTGEKFYVTGSDLALGSSTDGTDWTLDETPNANGSETGYVYNGLAYFHTTLLAAGDSGRIRDQFGNALNPPSLTAGWRAAAAGSGDVMVVGTGGAIAEAQIGYTTYRISSSGGMYVGGKVALAAAPSGGAVIPISSQWKFNGKPIAGATNPSLVLEPAALADAGRYEFDSLVANTTVSGYYDLSLQAGPPTAGLVDPTFRPVLSAQPQAIAALSDGRMYVVGGGDLSFTNGNRVQLGFARLNFDGSVDTSFNPENVVGSNLIVQPDGRVMVLGAASPIARYKVDGTRDNSFQPDVALRDSISLPILLADGRWLTATPRAGATGGRIVALARFSANGATDSSFGSPIFTPAFAAPAGTSPNFVLSAIDSQGRVYLAVHYGATFLSPFAAVNDSTLLFRLNADGTPDAGFVARSFANVTWLKATAAGLLTRKLEWTFSRPGYVKFTTTTFRLRFDGTDDPTFRPIVTEMGVAGSTPESVTFGLPATLADGSILMPTSAARGHRGIVRFDANGDFDSNFSAEIGPDAAWLQPFAPVPLPNGQVLVVGGFTSLSGEAHSYLARLTPDAHAATTHLSNISVRARAGVGLETLILGYVTTGGDTSVLVRGAGPALAAFNVPDVLADPQLSLFSNNTLVSANDDWGSGQTTFLATTAKQVGAFSFADGSRDAALYATLPTGAYTVQITGKNSSTGVALAELYDAGPRPTDFKSPRLSNFSVRTMAGTGGNTLIAGFAVEGTASRSVLIRAVGPGLSPFGVSNFLSNPILTLYRGSTPIASNDNWGTPVASTNIVSDLGLMSEAIRFSGPFPLASGSRDSALVVSLPPGLYSAQVTSADGATGVVLVEVYEIP